MVHHSIRFHFVAISLMVNPSLLPSQSHIVTGKRGEEIAEKHLLALGYKMLGRNVRTEGGEIDLIAKDGEVVVFVEVKSRTKDDGFAPSSRVDSVKIKRLKGAGQSWLDEQGEELSARIDVVGVCDGKVVEHFEDVGV